MDAETKTAFDKVTQELFQAKMDPDTRIVFLALYRRIAEAYSHDRDFLKVAQESAPPFEV